MFKSHQLLQSNSKLNYIKWNQFVDTLFIPINIQHLRIITFTDLLAVWLWSTVCHMIIYSNAPNSVTQHRQRSIRLCKQNQTPSKWENIRREDDWVHLYIALGSEWSCQTRSPNLTVFEACMFYCILLISTSSWASRTSIGPYNSVWRCISGASIRL
jgi:hypothetical protein